MLRSEWPQPALCSGFHYWQSLIAGLEACGRKKNGRFDLSDLFLFERLRTACLTQETFLTLPPPVPQVYFAFCTIVIENQIPESRRSDTILREHKGKHPAPGPRHRRHSRQTIRPNCFSEPYLPRVVLSPLHRRGQSSLWTAQHLRHEVKLLLTRITRIRDSEALVQVVTARLCYEAILHCSCNTYL
jgi:hypothetical protein